MMTDEKILGRILKGKRLLVRVRSVEAGVEQRLAIFALAREHGFRSIECRHFSYQIRCTDSGGFAHFVTRDEQVMGMEYHMAIGYSITPVMHSRVRL